MPMNWLIFALSTVVFWGLYGVMLHAGVTTFSAGGNPHGRYQAFLFVGIAYFITAVLAPLAMLVINGSPWSFVRNSGGVTWSLLAGVVGAAGAFCVLLAFAARGRPPEVMAIVFAGAPIVNAVVATLLHPPHGGWSSVRWPFLAGILLAALGGCLVTLYRPMDPPKAAAPPVTHAADSQ
jgi:hypothetical protein